MLAWTKPGAIPAVYPVYAPLRTCCRATRGSNDSPDSLQTFLPCLAASDMSRTRLRTSFYCTLVTASSIARLGRNSVYQIGAGLVYSRRPEGREVAHEWVL